MRLETLPHHTSITLPLPTSLPSLSCKAHTKRFFATVEYWSSLLVGYSSSLSSTSFTFRLSFKLRALSRYSWFGRLADYFYPISLLCSNRTEPRKVGKKKKHRKKNNYVRTCRLGYQPNFKQFVPPGQPPHHHLRTPVLY